MTTDADVALGEACLHMAQVAGQIGKLLSTGAQVPESATDAVDQAHEALIEALDAYHHPPLTLVPHLQVVR